MKKLFEKLSDIFFVTKSEIRLTISIFAILLVGYTVSSLDFLEKNYEINKRQFKDLTDSLTKLQKFRDSIGSLTISADLGSIESDATVEFYKNDLGIQSLDTSKSIGVFNSTSKKELPTKLVDIQNANKNTLIQLPGIGEKTAEVIIEHRKSSPFLQIEDIQNVKGIGPKKFEKMKPYITVKVKK